MTSGHLTSGPVVRQAFAWRTTGAAEHDIAALLADGETGGEVVLAATHFLPDHAGVAVTLETADGARHALGAVDPLHVAWVLARHEHRSGGRVFRFPGIDGLPASLGVGELLATTAIETVTRVGSPEPEPLDTRLDTQGFVRPDFVEGRLRLLVRPAADDRVVPFEQPNPTPCCAGHG